MKWNNNIKNWVSLSLLSIFCISTFSSYFFVRRFGFNAIEVVLLPLLLLYPQFIRRIKLSDWIVTFYTILALSVLSILSLSSIQLGKVYSPIRSYTIFFVAFFLLYRTSTLNIKYVFYVALCAKIFDFIGAIANLEQQVLMDSDSVINASNVVITPLILAYSYRNKPLLYFGGVCTLCFLASFATATRGIILYTSIDILICFLLKIRKAKTVINSCIILGTIAFISVNAYLLAEEPIRNYSLSLHHRLYTKVLKYDETVTGDKDRIGHITYMLENLSETLMPHGFPTRDASKVSFKNNRILWAVQDSSLVELFYTFGFLALVILFMLVRITFYHFKRRNSEFNYLMAALLINLIICLPMGYGLFMYPPVILTMGG